MRKRPKLQAILAAKARGCLGLPEPLEAGGDEERDFPGACRGSVALLTLDHRCLASRTGRKQISVAISHPVCGNLLQQPWKTNADSKENLTFKKNLNV